MKVYNRQRRVPLDLPWLQRVAETALREVGSEIPQGLDEIEATIVSDRAIADVHLRFMGIPGGTDVITFDHGEIVVSAETAIRQAAEFCQPVHHEIALYVIHGLLHLAGYDDLSEPAATRMQARQEAVLRAAIAQCGEAAR